MRMLWNYIMVVVIQPCKYSKYDEYPWTVHLRKANFMALHPKRKENHCHDRKSESILLVLKYIQTYCQSFEFLKSECRQWLDHWGLGKVGKERQVTSNYSNYK